MNWGSWLDEYDREARLVPALLALLPLVLAAVGLGFEKNAILVTVVGILLAVGLPMIVAKQVANRGRALEESLFAKWGGPPTTLALLLPAIGPAGEVLRQRRARLEHLTGIGLPTASTLTHTDADVYKAAVRWLIENTRDRSKFPVVWAELKSYGFERNLLGMRTVGVITSAISAVALAIGLVAGARGANLSVATNATLMAVCIGAGLSWWFVPRETRVRVAANRYADRLLDASAGLT
jgi:hypothetical protein